MLSKSKCLTKSELEAYEAKRDLAADILQSVREMKSGQVHVVSSPVIEARKKTEVATLAKKGHPYCLRNILGCFARSHSIARFFTFCSGPRRR